MNRDAVGISSVEALSLEAKSEADAAQQAGETSGQS